MDCIIAHYSEIGIKGGNRPYFEKMLAENIKKRLGKPASREGSKIVVESNDIKDLKILKQVMGIANYSPALRTKSSFDEIKQKALEIAQKSRAKTFKVIASRSWKGFEKNSQQINEEIGGFILEKTGMKVKMKNQGASIFVEVGKNNSYIYLKKIKGYGGLPVGTAGKVVSLISGGIDSPVASFLAMKRGAKVVFCHFANQTILTAASKNKVKDLVEKLSPYQNGAKLYIIPFGDFQREIIAKVKPKNRMIVYRRAMMIMAGMVMEKESAKALITGDNLAQVASQTLDNIQVIRSAAKNPVLSPLIGMNKEEIILIAKKIGTYETSIQPYPDCCSYLISNHPETKARIDLIEREEKEIEMQRLAEECVKNSEIVKY